MIKQTNEQKDSLKAKRVIARITYCATLVFIIIGASLTMVFVTDKRLSLEDVKAILALTASIVGWVVLAILAGFAIKALQLAILSDDESKINKNIVTLYKVFADLMFFVIAMLTLQITSNVMFGYNDNPFLIDLSQISLSASIFYGLAFLSFVVELAVLESLRKTLGINIISDKNTKKSKITTTSSTAHEDFEYLESKAENKRLKQELLDLENEELKEKIKTNINDEEKNNNINNLFNSGKNSVSFRIDKKKKNDEDQKLNNITLSKEKNK